MTRVRFAPSPTGSLHVGNALSAVANRDFGDWLLLRIDDTDPARNVPGGEVGFFEVLDGRGPRQDVRRHEDAAEACADVIYREAAWVLEGRRAS